MSEVNSGRAVFPGSFSVRNGVLVAEGTTGLDYTDGATVEDRMLQQVSAASDLSVLSPEIRALITDWPSRYHFDPGRANLVRPLRLRPGARILEVGAGCGAITRYLGENGFAVVAIEGSSRRAQIAAMRTRDLPGVRVVQGRLDEIDFDDRFDAVVLVGVLEYAAVYGDAGVDSHLALLRRCADLLAPNGVLVLAIENRLGLKYLAGAAEDHTGEPYIGINNGYAPNGPRTFTKGELRGLLAEAGLPVTEFLVPLPDYKVVRSVVRFSKAPESSLLSLGHLVAASFHDDPQHRGIPPFSLEETGAAIVSERAFEVLANSFLVLASRDERSITAVLDEREFAWSYAVQRAPGFAKATIMCTSDDGVCVKHPRLRPMSGDVPPLTQQLGSEPLQPGRSAWLLFVRSVNRSGWSVSDAAAALQGWYETLVAQSDHDPRCVSGEHVELTPLNVMDDGGQIRPFDQEWIWAVPVATDWVALRGILFSLQVLTSVAQPLPQVPLSCGGLASAILDDLVGRTRAGSDAPIGFMEWLSSLHALAGGRDVASERLALEDLWRSEIGVRSEGHILAAEDVRWNAALSASREAATAEAERLNAALSASEQTLRAFGETLLEREHALSDCEKTLAGVLASKSWRGTMPLRALTRMLRR